MSIAVQQCVYCGAFVSIAVQQCVYCGAFVSIAVQRRVYCGAFVSIAVQQYVYCGAFVSIAVHQCLLRCTSVCMGASLDRRGRHYDRLLRCNSVSIAVQQCVYCGETVCVSLDRRGQVHQRLLPHRPPVRVADEVHLPASESPIIRVTYPPIRVAGKVADSATPPALSPTPPALYHSHPPAHHLPSLPLVSPCAITPCISPSAHTHHSPSSRIPCSSVRGNSSRPLFPFASPVRGRRHAEKLRG